MKTKKIIFLTISCVLLSALFTSCLSLEPITKADRYPEMYVEQPSSILIMPPINQSTNVEAKDYFYSTLAVPFCDEGYYVYPPFLSLYILQRESAYDSEPFLNSDVSIFGEKFGADLLLFTVIDYWNKSVLTGSVDITLEYYLKSTKTNQIVFNQKATISVDTSSGSSKTGIIAELLIRAVNNALTDYVDVARKCNNYALRGNIPYGPYKPGYMEDAENSALYSSTHININ